MRSNAAELLSSTDGIEVAIADEMNILISERKIFPIRVAILYLKCGGGSFEE